MTHFFNLELNEIKKETDSSVSISLNIPAQLKDKFTYKSGQYITIKHEINGEEVVRSYSLCSSPCENDFRIGVKKIENGKMSVFLNEILKETESLEVMPPEGNFIIDIDADNNKHYVGVAAGSGITPILSMIKTVLLSEPKSRFTLYYSNRTKNTSMFSEEVELLVKEYPESFNAFNIYSREEVIEPLYKGRITKEKFVELMNLNEKISTTTEFFICGPEAMIFEVNEAVKEFGVDENRIHYELFGAPTDKMKKETVDSGSSFKGKSQVTVIMDGEDFDFELESDGDFVLDAAMDAGADAPFSCKGAVCCTCKAQVLEGEVVMEMNYSLSDEEVKNGFILTCQAHPASEKVVIDYDVT